MRAAAEPAAAAAAEPRNSVTANGKQYPVYDLKHEAKPRYAPKAKLTAAAKRESRGGTVLLGVLVNREGVVFDAAVAMTNADQDLQDAAKAAVHRWLFPIKVVDGEPIEYAVMVPITFDATPFFGPKG